MNQFRDVDYCNLQKLRDVLTPNNIDDLDHYGDTALYNTIRCRHTLQCCNIDCIKYCLEMGANVNISNYDGFSALHIITIFFYEGGTDFDIIHQIIDKCFSIDPTTFNARTPLYYALTDGYFNVARLFIDRGANIANVKIDKYLTEIPICVADFITSRSNCRHVSITFIGIFKHGRVVDIVRNDINVIKLIGKHIWSTRMNYKPE